MGSHQTADFFGIKALGAFSDAIIPETSKPILTSFLACLTFEQGRGCVSENNEIGGSIAALEHYWSIGALKQWSISEHWS